MYTKGHMILNSFSKIHEPIHGIYDEREVDPIKKDINIQIGQRVKEVRYSKKLTREQLAEKLDISTLHMGYIEAGHRGMSIATLLKLCLTLGVSADYILLGIDNANTPESSAQMILNTLDKEYLPLAEESLKNLVSLIEITKEKVQTQEAQLEKIPLQKTEQK